MPQYSAQQSTSKECAPDRENKTNMADSCEDLFGEEEPCESVGISSNNAELLEAGNNSTEYLNDTESLIALAQPELFPNVRDEVHTCPTTLPKILENEVEFTFPSKIQQEDYKEGLHRGQETLVEDLHVPYDKFTLPSKESCKTDSEETCRRSTAGDQLSSNPKGEKSDNHNTNFNSPVLFSSQELKSDVVVSEKSNSSVELHRENREETDFRRRYAGSKVNTVEKAFDTAYSPACFKIRKKQEENGNSSQAKGAQHKEITKPKGKFCTYWVIYGLLLHYLSTGISECHKNLLIGKVVSDPQPFPTSSASPTPTPMEYKF